MTTCGCTDEDCPNHNACRGCGAEIPLGPRRSCGALECGGKDLLDLLIEDPDDIAVDQDRCIDPGCERERDHPGTHMSRTWDAGNALKIVDEWDDRP